MSFSQKHVSMTYEKKNQKDQMYSTSGPQRALLHLTSFKLPVLSESPSLPRRICCKKLGRGGKGILSLK